MGDYNKIFDILKSRHHWTHHRDAVDDAEDVFPRAVARRLLVPPPPAPLEVGHRRIGVEADVCFLVELPTI